MSGTNQEIEGSGAISGPAGGELSGFYPNPTLVNSAVIGKVLTGYVSGAGTVLATDTLLQAIQKLNGNIAALPVITASNGLTKTGNNIELGGSLTSGIFIDGAFPITFGAVTPLTDFVVNTSTVGTQCQFTLSSSFIELITTDTGANQGSGLYANQIGFGIHAYTASSTNTSFYVLNSSVSYPDNGSNNYIIIEDTIGLKGAIYTADYSANFTPESLITKRYVDSTTVQSVTGTNVDNTDPNNPIINAPTLQEVIDESPTVDGTLASSLDGETYISINDNQISLSSTDGTDSTDVSTTPLSVNVSVQNGIDASLQTVTATTIDFTANSVTKNGDEIATEAYADLKLAIASNLSDLANSLTARVNLGVIDIHITTGDQTTTSNAASNITDLVSPTLTINSRYKINGLIRVGCNATGGVKLQITIPTGATMSVIADGNTSGTGGRAFNNITTSATLFTTPVGTINSVNSYVQISGEISIGATSGTIQFGFASATNTQLSSIYQLGTNITLIKIT